MRNALLLTAIAAILVVGGSSACALLEFARLEKATRAQVENAPLIAEQMRDKSIASVVAAINRQGDLSRVALIGRIDTGLRRIDHQLDEMRHLVDVHATTTEGIVAGESLAARRMLDARLGETTHELVRANNSIAGLSTSLAAVAKPAAEATQQISEALPLFLDCDHNADCAYNRYVGSSRAFEKTMGSIAVTSNVISREAPSIGEDIRGIAHDGHVITKAYISKKMIAFRALVSGAPLIGLLFK